MKRIFYVLILIAISGVLNAQKLTVASYNIRNNNKSDSVNGNGWYLRCPVISQLITFNDFDIIGMQEVLHGQLEDLLANLPEYTYVGIGRDDGKTKGEYAPIFYKKDKFKVLQTGNFWLSENTDYPNKGWDAALPRICTWVELKDKDSKKKIWFFNLHMDHVGVKAREESAKLVLQKIEDMCSTKDIVILTGDFNVDQTHESYRLLANSNILSDSYEIAGIRYALNGTFNNFDPNLKTDSRIDHVFVSKGVSVERYGILTDTYRSEQSSGEKFQSGNFPKEVSLQKFEARIPSDHFPLKVILDVAKRKK
ncbi:endonuclease/exonuclease/phosphatase family protein [Dysgonomonas sp. BGC7]|uniref:endonuclease/exonuclease/phosphatase family protein n=1 Tax=Dysgonomonas sp. BGC7 TaxID=1658008 RepID=UPI0006826131|nr:endonuclease/exonuclease/phosphatase family protein [Dysgonomonas sp. BGC7]MBD8387706.1 endonuclease/exonuclease/phosphatase family protein [Dysgonomonas sp. BGC7]